MRTLQLLYTMSPLQPYILRSLTSLSLFVVPLLALSCRVRLSRVTGVLLRLIADTLLLQLVLMMIIIIFLFLPIIVIILLRLGIIVVALLLLMIIGLMMSPLILLRPMHRVRTIGAHVRLWWNRLRRRSLHRLSCWLISLKNLLRLTSTSCRSVTSFFLRHTPIVMIDLVERANDLRLRIALTRVIEDVTEIITELER